MPDFARAQVTETAEDLSAYLTFLRRFTAGQVVTLPLEDGESSRVVMRTLNRAATQSAIRLARLPSNGNAVRFRVLSAEKRSITLSEEARRARAAKARATRRARGGVQDAAGAAGEDASQSSVQPALIEQVEASTSRSTDGVHGEHAEHPDAPPRRQRRSSRQSTAST